jgi:hypothetical protein
LNVANAPRSAHLQRDRIRKKEPPGEKDPRVLDKIVFEDTRTAYRAVRLNADGSLTIEGQDLGDSPSAAYGGSEFEFARTVNAEGVAQLRSALGLGDGADLLGAIRREFETSGTRGLEGFLGLQGIRSEFWSRVGD